MAGLHAGPVDDHTGRNVGDQLGGLQAVGAQGIAGIDDIHDAVRQPHQRGQFHGAVQLDHFCLLALLGVVGLGHIHKLGGHSQAAAGFRGVFHGRHHQFAAGNVQIHRFKDPVTAVLHKHVFTGHTDIRRAMLHIGRHVRGADDDDFHIVTGGVENQFA